jgi:hypothetical protein
MRLSEIRRGRTNKERLDHIAAYTRLEEFSSRGYFRATSVNAE